ncbi:hypothetical protein BHE90_011633 [Fusarium euwallaceae]|uniref:Uncharacterized protein n=1 Tax=Fusarium euwallaceae TaxID=1147111 RepID=A0A430LDY4_9HYPO|nr:hypothetical protein BHE90_011633 [Fusarium euwallaceae]
MAGDAQANRHGACLPSIPCIDQDPQADDQENSQSQVALHLFGSHTGDNYLCRPIQARRGLQRQSATAGPLLLLDGTSYQLTVEHVVNFDHHKSEPTWEHTNDDWDDDDDDDYDDTRGYGHVEDMVPTDFGTVRTTSEGSLSSEDSEIDTSGSSSSSSGSVQELERNTSWSPVEPTSTSHPQSFSEPRTVDHIAVKDSSSSPQIELGSSSTRCYTSSKMDYLLFPIYDPELCTTRGAEMVQMSDVFDVHGQTKARSVIIATASLGYVRGTIFPASTLLLKPGSRGFQTLFCIESAVPMPKGTSGSAVFDARTGLLAGYLALGCPGKCTFYMVPMCDVLADLNMLSRSIVLCQVQLNVSAIVEMPPEKSSLVKLGFPRGSLNQSIPWSSTAPRELGHVPDVIHKPTHHAEENLRGKDISLEPRKSSVLAERITRFTTFPLEWVSWSEPDEWKKRCCKNTRLRGSIENRPFFDILKENGIEESSQVQTFFRSRGGSSARWDRRILHMERFCEGASSDLDRPVPGDTENPVLVSFVTLSRKGISHKDQEQLCHFLLYLVVSFERAIDEKNYNEQDSKHPTFQDIQGPRAWVSDRNWAPEGLPPPQRSYGRILNCIELHEVLQKKRFRDDACNDKAGHSRRIYINNPNGSSLLALMRTAPSSQVESLSQLFAGYVTPTPEPNFRLRESTWWGGCFCISFNLPFFTIRPQNGNPVRTSPAKKNPLRSSYDLSFLNLNRKSMGTFDSGDSISDHNVCLKEVVCSLAVTGKSERYWTAVFLDEDSFDDEPRLSMENKADPIILEDETNSTAITASPRAYALAALATVLDKIVEHHRDIQDCLKDNFNVHIPDIPQNPPSDTNPQDIQGWTEKFRSVLERVTHSNCNLVRKLDHFLSEDVILGIDTLPHGVLWQSLQSEPDALKSLLTIKICRDDLRDIAGELDLLRLATREKERNLRSDVHDDEQMTSLSRENTAQKEN